MEKKPTNLVASNYVGEQKLFLVLKTLNNTFNEFIALIPAESAEAARERFKLRGNVEVIPIDEVDGFNVNLTAPSDK